MFVATEGFTFVGEAASGEAALTAASNLSPMLMLLDQRMPGMSGIEAARHLSERHPEVVVILVSVEEPRRRCPARVRSGRVHPQAPALPALVA